MKIKCLNCGSICRVEFEEDETTETFPLFCPFCGESVEDQFLDDEDPDGETLNYLERIFDEGKPDEE